MRARVVKIKQVMIDRTTERVQSRLRVVYGGVLGTPMVAQSSL